MRAIESLAAELDVPVRTLQRWVKQWKQSPPAADTLTFPNQSMLEQLYARASQRTLRRATMKVLMDSGRSQEAARKYIQRQCGNGESLIEIIRGTRGKG